MVKYRFVISAFCKMCFVLIVKKIIFVYLFVHVNLNSDVYNQGHHNLFFLKAKRLEISDPQSAEDVDVG